MESCTVERPFLLINIYNCGTIVLNIKLLNIKVGDNWGLIILNIKSGDNGGLIS